MSHSIDSQSPTNEWEGPVIRKFQKIEDKTKTVRYQCPLQDRVFDWYVPKFLLESIINDKTPDTFTVEIGKSCRSGQLYVGKGICEYEFDTEMVNSIRYSIVYASSEQNDREQKYYLYVPKEEFGAKVRPEALYVKLVDVL